MSSFLCSVDGTCAMAYLSSQCHVLMRLDNIVTKYVEATFVNPVDGTEVAGTYETGYKLGSIFPRALLSGSLRWPPGRTPC
jgi:hypothetical protein